LVIWRGQEDGAAYMLPALDRRMRARTPAKKTFLKVIARITVEDCLENIDNIFEMVLVAAKRARRIAHGAEPMVELENDKPTVLALREIADGHVTPAILDELEQPPAEEFMTPEVADEILPVRGISIGD